MAKKCNTKTRKEKTKMIEPQKDKRNLSDYYLTLSYRRYADDKEPIAGTGCILSEDLTKLDELDLQYVLNQMIYQFKERIHKLQKEEK